MKRAVLLLAAAVLWTAPALADTNDTIVIEAKDAPVESVVDGILKSKKVNFVYSNSALGIGTNRPPRIEMWVSKPAKKKVAKTSKEALSKDH